jgi:hypothetical protein
VTVIPLHGRRVRGADAGPGFTAAGIAARVEAVVEPVARTHRGEPVPAVRAALRRAWRDGFGGPLDEPGLTWCAEAIHDARPWGPALWGGS